MANVNKMKQKIDELKQKRNELVKEFFSEQSKVLFDKFPTLQSFGFLCYAPYFCDGDPCEFGVHFEEECGLRVNGLANEEIYAEGSSYRNLQYVEGITKEMVNEVTSFLGSIDTDDYEAMFGNNTEVTVDRNGVTIDDYSDHD